MSFIFATVAFGFVGTFLAALWTYAIGVAGAPGALYTAYRQRGADNVSVDADGTAVVKVPLLGLMLTAVGQLLAMLIFTVFVVESTRSMVDGTSGVLKWFGWIVAWWVAGAPAWMASKDSAQAEPRTVQHFATAFSAPLDFVAFFLFVFWPQLAAWGFSWVPRISAF